MQKITKTTFRCEYCKKEFKQPSTCLTHETKCKIRSNDISRLTRYVETLVLHYHKLGYNIEIRYSDYFDNGLLVDLSMPKK